MTKPCKGCGGNGKPIFTDGEDFWKWDPESELFRMVDYKGDFHPQDTHPGTTEQKLVQYFGKDLKLATENDIIWRTLALIVDAMLAANML